MSIPDELLNRRNRELKEKIQQLHATQARTASTLQLERDVLRVTDTKLAESRTQLVHLQALYERRQQFSQEESSSLTKLKGEVEKLKGVLNIAKSKYGDFSRKVEALEQELDGKKAALEAADGKRSELEQLMITWAGDNAVTGEAQRMADGMLKTRAQQLKDLQKEADLKRATIRQIEDLLWEETTTTDQISSDIVATKRKIEMLDVEKHEAYVQLQQAVAREEAAGENRRVAEEKANLIRQQMDIKKRELAQIAAELDAQRALERQTLAARGTADGLRHKAEARLRAARENLTDDERQLDDLERELQLAEMELTNQGRVREERVAYLAEQQAKLDRLLERLEKLQEEEKRAIEEGLGNDASVVALQREQERMIRFLYSKTMELDSAIHRGRHLLHAQQQDQMQASAETETITNELMLLQRAVGKTSQGEGQLKATLKAITEAAAAIEVQGIEVERLLQEETAKRNEANSEIRAALKARIQELREDVDRIDKDNAIGKRAVEELASQLRREGRSMGDEESLLRELTDEEEARKSEINRLHVDLAKYAEEKQRVAEVAEGLHWRVVDWKRRTDTTKSVVRDTLLDQAALEQEIREREALIQSEINGYLVELHAHQDDVHRLNKRFNETSHRLGLLRSRHDDMLAAMKRQMVAGASDLGDPSSTQMLQIQDSAKSGLSHALALANNDNSDNNAIATVGGDVTDISTVEELQARAFMQRALIREQLQEKGDFLDRAIVASEKQLRRVSVALEKLEKSVAEGRERILSGEGDPDGILFGGDSEQLLIADRNSAAAAEQQEINTILAEEQENQLLAQLGMYEGALAELDATLRRSQDEEAEVVTAMMEERAKLESAKSLRHQLHRHLIEIAKTNTKEGNQTEKLRQVAFHRQLSVVRNAGSAAASGATPRVSMGALAIANTIMEEADKMNRVCAKLVDLATAASSVEQREMLTTHHHDPSASHQPRMLQQQHQYQFSSARQRVTCLEKLKLSAQKYGLDLPPPGTTLTPSDSLQLGSRNLLSSAPVHDLTRSNEFARNRHTRPSSSSVRDMRAQTHTIGSNSAKLHSFDFTSLKPDAGPKRAASKALVEAYTCSLSTNHQPPLNRRVASASRRTSSSAPTSMLSTTTPFGRGRAASNTHK